MAGRQIKQGGIDRIDDEVAAQVELRAQPIGNGVAEAAFAGAAIQQGQVQGIGHRPGLQGNGRAG